MFDLMNGTMTETSPNQANDPIKVNINPNKASTVIAENAKDAVNAEGNGHMILISTANSTIDKSTV